MSLRIIYLKLFGGWLTIHLLEGLMGYINSIGMFTLIILGMKISLID